MTSLPSPRPNLAFYRKQAKQLVREVRAGEGLALERIRPQLRHIVSLADAQLVIAREQGFQSWASFQERMLRSAAAGSTAIPQAGVPSPALAALAELLEGEAFVWPCTACADLRAALDRADAIAAAKSAYDIEWALRKLATGHAVSADRCISRAVNVERSVGDRAVRAAELLARVVREEALDLSVIRCSFCLKGTHEVVKLVQGAQGYICDACTAAAAKVLEQQTE